MDFCDLLGNNTLEGAILSIGRGALLLTVWEQSVTPSRSILPALCRDPGLWGPHAESGPAVRVLPKEVFKAMLAQHQPSKLPSVPP